jgi:hypothetical protein
LHLPWLYSLPNAVSDTTCATTYAIATDTIATDTTTNTPVYHTA